MFSKQLSKNTRISTEIRRLQNAGFNVLVTIENGIENYNKLTISKDYSLDVCLPIDYPYNEPLIKIKGLQGVTLIRGWSPSVTLIDIYNDYVSQIGKSLNDVLIIAKQNKSGFGFIPWDDEKMLDAKPIENL